MLAPLTYAANMLEETDVNVLERILKTGTPVEKESVLENFRKNKQAELVPAVIEAILDNTESPPDGDSGWGRVYHQAATYMSEYARKIDGKDQKERGYKEYSFYNDVGTANSARRKEVHDNWLMWYRIHRLNIVSHDILDDVKNSDSFHKHFGKF